MGGRGGRSSRGGGGSGSRSMAKLSGTEKQVTWATELRQKVVNALDKSIPDFKRVAPTKEAFEQAESMVKKMIGNLKSADKAGDIIDLFKDVSFSGTTEEVFGKIMAVYNVTVPKTTGQRKILGR